MESIWIEAQDREVMRMKKKSAIQKQKKLEREMKRLKRKTNRLKEEVDPRGGRKKMRSAMTAAAVIAAASTAAVAVRRIQKKKKAAEKAKPYRDDSHFCQIENEDRQAFLAGGGLASMAAAVYLIRDAGFSGENIHIFEGLPITGGSNDGSGDPDKGFLVRGGRMLNEETYENFWELFSHIPSLEQPGKSVAEEILSFDRLHPTCAKARLIDSDGVIQDVTGMGFDQKDRNRLFQLLFTPEEKLDHLRICDWFFHTPHFFETNFWYMWQTTFAFQKWSSLFEFRRYLNRMIFEFSRIETLEGVTRTPYNQYESVILPLKEYLEDQGVCFETNTLVTDIDFLEGAGITASAIHLEQDGEETVVELMEGDLCFITNGCMTDCAGLGDLKTPAPYQPDSPISGRLWERVAAKKPGLGDPSPFFQDPKQTNWESFTVTMKGDGLLKRIEAFSGNVPGSGALMTFKDSSWLLSIVVAYQPHFKNQPEDQTILWGYGLYTDRIGDYVKKPMSDCTGEELLYELIHQLHFEDQLNEFMESAVNVIPCMMPYIDAQFQPRAMSDRPLPVPKGSVNFAMISQFVELSEDMVFTEEYSVRAARTAVYQLLNIQKKICPVTPYRKDPNVLFRALKKAYQ